MGANQNERVNESKIMGSEYEEIDPYFSKVSKSICKIFISTQNGTQYGSGVFLKFSIEDLNLFCLITNEHIIYNNWKSYWAKCYNKCFLWQWIWEYRNRIK